MESKLRAQLRALCAELREDDGVDPREFFKSGRRRDKEHHKSRQLCRQVQKTLELVLTGEMRDDLLSGLKIVSIVPGEDASTLVVTVRPDLPTHQCGPEEIQARLEAVRGRLRSEVAASITRKKTPTLLFHVLPTEHQEERE